MKLQQQEPRQLADWSAGLPKPTAILIVSAHCENAPLTLGATTTVPLVEMYPDADVPVLQISMPTLDPVELMAVGQKLAPLRDDGVLIIGSGFFTHNLSRTTLADPAITPPSWSAEFDHWGAEALAARDVDGLLDFLDKAPAGRLAHPRTEHFAPLFVSIGAGLSTTETPQTMIDGYWFGLAKRSVQFD